MLPLGTRAPDFSLPDVTTNRVVSFADVDKGHGVLVMFICAHCPFVKHIERDLARIANDATARGLGIVAISANDAAWLSGKP